MPYNETQIKVFNIKNSKWTVEFMFGAGFSTDTIDAPDFSSAYDKALQKFGRTLIDVKPKGHVGRYTPPK